jgi:D-alanine-D-alanine ligase
MNWADERVALLFGGLGSEADVSRDGKQNVAQAMREIGIEPIEIDIKDGLLEPLMAANPTRVFNLVHGRPGEDGVLQGLLCALGIPFTGVPNKSGSPWDYPLHRWSW